MLRLAGALEAASEHPIARAVAARRRRAAGTLPAAEDFANVEGLGVQGIVDGAAVLVGRPRLLADWSQHAARRARAGAPTAAERAGGRPIAVGWDGAARGVAGRRPTR